MWKALSNPRKLREIMSWFLTVLVLLVVLGTALFYITGDWSYIQEIEYWTRLGITTGGAFVLRAIWMKKGRRAQQSQEDIVKLERSKEKRLKDVSRKSLIPHLNEWCHRKTMENKAVAYRNKCDRKIIRLGRKSKGVQYKNPKNKEKWIVRLLKWRRRANLRKRDKWMEEKEKILAWHPVENPDAINVENLKWLSYEKVKPERLMANYRETGGQTPDNADGSTDLYASYTLNILTTIVFAVIYGIQIVWQGVSSEDVFIIIAQLSVLLVNIYFGYEMGVRSIDTGYKHALSTDISHLDEFLNNNKNPSF